MGGRRRIRVPSHLKKESVSCRVCSRESLCEGGMCHPSKSQSIAAKEATFPSSFFLHFVSLMWNLTEKTERLFSSLLLEGVWWAGFQVGASACRWRFFFFLFFFVGYVKVEPASHERSTYDFFLSKKTNPSKKCDRALIRLPPTTRQAPLPIRIFTRVLAYLFLVFPPKEPRERNVDRSC